MGGGGGEIFAHVHCLDHYLVFADYVARQRDRKLEDDIRRASEEKEPFLVDGGSSGGGEGGGGGGGGGKKEVGGSRRTSTKSRESIDKRTRTGSGEAGKSEVMGPSICPASPFCTFVSCHTADPGFFPFPCPVSSLSNKSETQLSILWCTCK